MTLIVVILVPLLVIILARSFMLNAAALRRDRDRRFDELRIRLERAANATVAHLFEDDTHGSHS
jgi:hypothetical protein